MNKSIQPKNLNAFLELIKGLEYNNEKDEYTFKGTAYKLYEIEPLNKIFSAYKFISTGELVHAVTVKCTTDYGIPIFDGFNNVKTDKNLRHIQYTRAYYYKVRRPKTELVNALKPPKEPIVKEKKSYNPISCMYCGNKFIPRNSIQKFCSKLCQHKFNSEKQSKAVQESKKFEKSCPVCGKIFKANKSQTYCSKECYKVSQKICRHQRYLRDKNSAEKSGYGRKIDW